MVKAVITLRFDGEVAFVSKFTIQEPDEEYLVADEAYRLAVFLAETKAIAKYGRPFSAATVAEMLERIDEEYELIGED